MGETLLNIIGVGLLMLGLGTATIGLYGLLRMSEVFHQLHAAGLILGPAILVILLASIATRNMDIVTSSALVFLFVLITAPLSGHAIAQAARHRAAARADERDDPS